MKSTIRIKCAAIKYNGKIYVGLKMISDGICPRPYPSGDEQGFVTECGLYVRREPALIIAIDAGQVVKGKTMHPNKLFSEDLRRQHDHTW